MTAIREVREEVGLDLNSPEWKSLGRIAPDYTIQAGGRPLIISLHGFARVGGGLCDTTPDSREVEFAWWVPAATIDPARLSWAEKPLEELSGAPNWILRALSILGVGPISFPGIKLPSPKPGVDCPILWGITLRLLSEMRVLMDFPALVGPSCPQVPFRESFRVGGSLIPRLLLSAVATVSMPR